MAPMSAPRWCSVLLIVAVACSRREAPRPLGRVVAPGVASALRASPDGAYLAYLRKCQPLQDRTLPRDAAACELAVVAASGGEPVRVAGGVTSLGGGFTWARTGHALAALADYDLAAARGALVTWTGGEPRRVAADVTFHGFDREGRRLAWISGGQLFVAGPDGGAPQRIAGADRLSTFEFGPGSGLELLARRGAGAGGTLLAVRSAAVRPLAEGVHEYEFSATGGLVAFTVGRTRTLAVASGAAPELRVRSGIAHDVQSFLFSPRSEALAFVADATPGRQGDLWIVTGRGEPVLVARRVGEPRWSEDGAHLAWLQDYDPRSRTGVLAMRGPEGRARVVARNVSDFDLTADGSGIAGLVHDTAAGYSVNLALAAGGAAPATIARGVFGFGFSPDARWLYYRTACTREAEACDLLRIPASGPRQGSPPERIAEASKSFEFAPGDPDQLLVTWSRKDRLALDLAVWKGGRLVAVDTSALPGSARFLGGNPARLAWIGNDPKRPGVYVAEVP